MPAKDKAPKAQRPPRDTAPVTTDSRFSIIHSDPRFAPPKKKDTTIKLDDRFRTVLSDPKFSSKAPRVDRYGRKLPKGNAKEELSRFYRVESDTEGEEDDESEDEEEDEAAAPRFDPARGEGLVDTDDSDDSDEDEPEITMEEGVEEERKVEDEIPTGEVTKRIACVNLDWDNVRAVDLMKAFSSFAPSGGRVVKVTVYPSEFGKERMQREELEGPPREIFAKDKPDEDGYLGPDESDDEEVDEKTVIKEDKGEEFDSAKLRKYQLERLRYYYAVVECDSERTAQHIYENCDGAEYEASANFFDLRFIPEEVSFEDDEPRDICDKEPTEYAPQEFVTDALQHSKVKLTWDADDTQRKLAAKKAFSQRDIEETELKAYLASDSESDMDDKDKAAEKYRALLGGLTFGGKTKNEPTGEMEVTFTTGLDKDKDGGKVLELEETTIEKYKRKEKERREARKQRNKNKNTEEGEKEEEEPKEAEEKPGKGKKGKKDNKKPSKPEPEEEKLDQAAIDLGFDDPFFAEPAASNAALKKAEKEKKRQAKQAEAAEKESKRAELELLMADDDNILGRDGKKLSHFDMKTIVKAEKQKKIKKAKHKKDLKEAEGLQEDFKIDVKDERFKAVFERHDFAIDPTNARFMKTEATKKILEEKRKRAAGRDLDAPEEEHQAKKTKTENKPKKSEAMSLVEKLKRKAGKV
ncbi:RNA-binding protein [Pyronema omphalodes]|nr:RNA-binding protein [Pyronema omphalodes]